ncbi:MAG: glutathione S-transferase family protein [Bdellovibrionales bacterium]|nr:glutathione S-transferase family protein [Bdellovibrionales bacterium]
MLRSIDLGPSILHPKIQKPFRLTAIHFSPYVEKVRWVLDLYQIPYVERALMPVLHFAVLPWVVGLKGKKDSQSSRFSTPVVYTDRGECLSDSSSIVSYVIDRFSSVKPGLAFDQEMIAFDQYCKAEVGPGLRKVFYHSVLQDRNLMRKLAIHNVGPIQAKLFDLSFPWIKVLIEKGLVVTEKQSQISKDQLRRAYDRVEKMLSDGRPFLFGDRLSAADISWACLGGAMCMPSPNEGYGAFLPDLEIDLRDRFLDLYAFVKECRQHRAGQHALFLFSQYRNVN